MITIEDFAKLDIRIVKVLEAERVPESEKLVKLKVSLGDSENKDYDTSERQIIAGIGKSYNPEDLIGQNLVAIINLEPRKLMGLESQGMILATGDNIENISLLKPDREVKAGGKIR